MSGYQVIARRFRPQTFGEILGQEAIVTTLKNAIQHERLAHAYLFCGPRGTGKTTLARVFAKALNCLSPTASGEPCNACGSCKEITYGNSLDVLEVDGASNRGIDDIRQINDTVAYATSSGKFKIYIIDEVHMLTKEAFNALLKTLEEPPPNVKFFFATTEPHKVLPTILSRCQRYHLKRIPVEIIIQKLLMIAHTQARPLEIEAAQIVASRAEGAFRDAESLLDQVFAFHEGPITAKIVGEVLGLMPREVLFDFDCACKTNQFITAFEIVEQLFSEGKDLAHFIEMLTNHFRTLLLVKLAGPDTELLDLADSDRLRYAESARIYTREQCLTAIELLVEGHSQIRFSAAPRIALEALLLKLLQLPLRISIDYLVRRLQELENALQTPSQNGFEEQKIPKTNREASEESGIPKQIATPELLTKEPSNPPLSPQKSPSVPSPRQNLPPSNYSITIDPLPTIADLGLPSKVVSQQTQISDPTTSSAPKTNPVALPPPLRSTENRAEALQRESRYDTLLQFAAVELEGSLQKQAKR